MKKIVLSISITLLLLNSSLNAAQESKEAELSALPSVKNIFTESKVLAQARSLYSRYDNDTTQNQYATAMGGWLRYELAEFNGFNALLEFSTSNDISFATGDAAKQNSEISSKNGNYTELSQAYINYKNEALNIRAGRQLLDTPLADSDDIRIVLNTFEAYTATYESNGFIFMGGLLTKWQGTDAGLSVSNPWSKTGKDGTYFGGVSYAADVLNSSLWYYDISADNDPLSATGNVANSSFYTDLSLHMALSKDHTLHTSVQYLNQSESDNSGIGADIYGVMAKIVMFENFELSAAHNRSKKHKGRGSFSGFGGGVLFTNMDSMILDAISFDRDVQAVVVGATYAFDNYNFMYAYGNFDGGSDGSGAKERIVEQNVGIEYVLNEKLTIGTMYVKNADKKNSGSNGGDWENFRVQVSYSF